MRATILALSALLSLALCVVQEVSAEKPGFNQASINKPITLSKRGGKGKKSKGHGGKHGHHGHHGKDQSGDSDSGGDSNKGGNIIDTVSATISKSIPDTINPLISGIKLPSSSAIVFGISLSWFQVDAVKINHIKSAQLHRRKLNVHKRAGNIFGFGGILSQSGAQTSGSPVQMVQIPGAPAGSLPPGALPPPAPGGGAPPSSGGGASPSSGGGSSPLPLPLPLLGAGGLPTIPAITLPPAPIPAVPGLPVSVPTLPALGSLPALPAIPALPASDEFNAPNLDPFAQPD